MQAVGKGYVQPARGGQQPTRGRGQARGANGVGRGRGASSRGIGNIEERQPALVYAAHHQEDGDALDIITGMFLIHNVPYTALIDIGSTHSYIACTVSGTLGISVRVLFLDNKLKGFLIDHIDIDDSDAIDHDLDIELELLTMINALTMDMMICELGLTIFSANLTREINLRLS
ncbi:hypothetical protein Goarm_023076, partial [Gossypium armourianum]|nr:hypothetical protein [Gossypium armourianum]